MKAIDRLYEYFKVKAIKPTALEKAIGLSNGYLGTQKKRNADMGESVILKIIDNCRDVSLVWLLTGEGEMLMSSAQVQQQLNSSDSQLIDKVVAQAEEIGRLKARVEQLEAEKGKAKDRIRCESSCW